VSATPSPSRRTRLRSAVSLIALALVGLVVAAVVSLAASRLSSQHIGLSSEPLTAGQRLTPAEVSTARQEDTRPQQPGATTTTRTTAQPPELDQRSGKPDEPEARRDSDDD
jgi:hypothetical protein